MLKIQVADWESEQEHFRMKLHDYFEQVIQNGLDTIDKNENLNEFLGNVITTKRLYDDTVGIGSVKIKLYKIEAELKSRLHGQRYQPIPAARALYQRL